MNGNGCEFKEAKGIFMNACFFAEVAVIEFCSRFQGILLKIPGNVYKIAEWFRFSGFWFSGFIFNNFLEFIFFLNKFSFRGLYSSLRTQKMGMI